MELSDYLRAGLKELQNKRTLISHAESMQQQMQRRRSSRLQNLMNIRKINEATLSPIITPMKVKTPLKLKTIKGSPSLKRTNSKSNQHENSKVIKEEKKQEKSQPVDKRRALLLKWKEEKNKKLKLEKSHKKPIFKVSHAANLPSIDSANQFIKGKRITPKSKGNTPSAYKFAPTNHVFKPPVNIQPIYFKNSTTKCSNMPVIKNTLLPQENMKNTIKSKRKLEFKSDNKPKIQIAVVQPTIVKDKTSTNNKDTFSNKYCVRTDNATANNKVKKSPRPNSSKKLTQIEATSSTNTRKLPFSTSKDKPTKKVTADELKTNPKKPNKNTSVTNLNSEKSSKHKTPKKTLSKDSSPKRTSSLSSLDKVCPSKTENDKMKNKTVKSNRKTDKSSGLRREKEVSQESIKFSKSPEKETCTVAGNTESLKPPKKETCTVAENAENLKSPVTPIKSNSFPQTPKNNNNPPKYISPFITFSRGKDSARKEYKQRLSKGGTYEDSDLSKYTSPKAAARYFTYLLDSEVSEILEFCEKWEFHKQDESLPDGACDMIDVAVGQSHLLINQKLEQFRGLIRSAESKDGRVTCHDLHGFWDLVNIQIKNVKDRFANLERLQNSGWEEIICVKTKTPSAKKKNPSRNKVGKRKVDSKIKGFIEAARLKTKSQTDEQKITEESESKGSFLEEPSSNKTLRRRRSSTVSISERGTSSPGLTIMRASLSAKSLQQTLSSNSTPINLNKSTTAVKSILKSGQIKSSKKRYKSVLFKTAFDDNLIIHSDTRENDTNTQNIEPSNNVKKSIGFSPEDSKVVRRSSRLGAKLPKSKLF